jgi:hypothetical protein
MTARFSSWRASEPAKTRTLTAAVAPRSVEASIAIDRLRHGTHEQGGERNLIERLRCPVVIIDRHGPHSGDACAD